ncbi:hypothetical protein WJX84_008706 [Apatococcus fuscideae]|uniref:ATP-dependent RNA helicase n=1 Tax=Apatococcus fuscideae TaxID=2026836 RepID=A0AAW1TA59_9CHLO
MLVGSWPLFQNHVFHSVEIPASSLGFPSRLESTRRQSAVSSSLASLNRLGRTASRASSATATACAHQEPAASSEAHEGEFLAPAQVSFASLGLSQTVAEALAAAGFDRPAQVQALSIPAICGGRSVVLAAETGSGKTLAYLAPIISTLLERRPVTGRVSPRGERWAYDGALVLCANAALCQQVVVAADKLRDTASGEKLVRTAFVNPRDGPPLEPPDLIVSTPAGLIGTVDTWSESAGWEWTSTGLANRLRHVVVDEADLLLGGGYAKALWQVLDTMRGGDKERRIEALCKQVGTSPERFHSLPYPIRKQALEGGAKGGAKYLESRLAKRDAELWGSDSASHPASSGHKDASAAAALDAPERTWERQYVFVAATMPEEPDGARGVSVDLRKRFPGLQWLAGRQLHQAQQKLQHTWVSVSDANWESSLVGAVRDDPSHASGSGRTLVFASTTNAANAVAELLAQSHLEVVIYHRNIPVADQADALKRMSSERGLVMVCTDAAARGLDIPHVTHVVQADFASSAVDFLHRVGRSARAGQGGRITSLIMPEKAVLAGAIQAAVEAGQPVEGAFSRNRSFRKKLRKYGDYVPRGQQGELSDGHMERKQQSKVLKQQQSRTDDLGWDD